MNVLKRLQDHRDFQLIKAKQIQHFHLPFESLRALVPQNLDNFEMCHPTPTLPCSYMAATPFDIEEILPFNFQLRTPISAFLEFVPMNKAAPGGVRYPVLDIVLFFCLG